LLGQLAKLQSLQTSLTVWRAATVGLLVLWAGSLVWYFLAL
jgi:hypothetical protein